MATIAQQLQQAGNAYSSGRQRLEDLNAAIGSLRTVGMIGGTVQNSLRKSELVGQALAQVRENNILESEQASLNQRAQLDPWGFYRASAADNLAAFSEQADPSNVYRSKLQQMTMGKFSPDDPSYRWRFEQGQQAVERSLAARGLLNSGNAAIELQQYGQGAASQEYAAQFDRLLRGLAGVDAQYNNQFNRLAQLAGINLNPAAGPQINAQERGQSLSAMVGLAGIAEEARQFNVGQQNLANYNQGLASALQGQPTAP